MAHTPHDWSTGDVITAALLDSIETDLAAAADATETTAAIAAAQSFAVQRGNHTGSQLSGTISDFAEAAQDAASAMFRAGANVTFAYDDAANTFTINASGGGAGTTDPEVVRDTIGGALVGGANIQITVNDAADSITIAVTGLAPVATSGAYTDLTGRPTLGTAASQDSTAFDLAGAAAAVTKASLGLGNVDNTADVNKPVSTAQQAALDLKAKKTDIPSTYRRGVNTQGGGANIDDGTQVPGVLGTNYWYNSQAFYNYIAARGHTIVRIDFLWERVQPTLNGPLSTTGIQALKDVVTRATSAGLAVLLDMKNYGRYWVNSTTRASLGNGIDVTWFADVWSKIATAFQGAPGDISFGLMNEPYGLPTPSTGGTTPSTWKTFSQAAVTAIRATGDTHDIYVAGDEFSGLWGFPSIDGQPWIVDPYTARNAIVYEAHLYMDHDRSGTYASGSYATEESADQTAGWLDLPSRVVSDCNTFAGWLTQYGVRGFVGEFGWPSTFDSASWNSVAQKAYDVLNAAGIGVCYWATGEHLSAAGGGLYMEDLYYQGNFVPQAQATVVEAAQNMSRPATNLGAVRAVETLAKVRPTGQWDFTVAPTVGGATLGGSSVAEYSIAAGNWWSPTGGATGTGALSVVGTAVMFPIALPATQNIDQLALEVTTAGTTGATIGAAIYNRGIDGLPDFSKLLVEFPAVASTATGIKTLPATAAVQVPRGLVWVGVVARVATCTIRTSSNGNPVPLPLPAGISPTAGTNIQVFNVGASSAFPSTGALGQGTILMSPPKVWIRGA